MQAGIIGLPNVGKTTIFNSLARAHAAVANYPFCTIEPNQGLISVPDRSLELLAGIYNSAKITPAAIKILDVAGLVEGASSGEGLGNKFLASIREVDVIAHIVRCFYDENVAHSADGINPANDIEIINTELLLADIEILSRRREKYISVSKSGDIHARDNVELIDLLIGLLDTGQTDKSFHYLSKNPQLFAELNLLSLKPVLFIANTNEDKTSEVLFEQLVKKVPGKKIIKIYGKIESELCDFPEDEQCLYRKELGIENSGLKDFISQCYSMLDLITFYTINENETRAWALKKNLNILEAAGKIHSDMQEGFIKAEVINCEDLLSAGSFFKAREEGKLKIEGRDYTVMDRDVILIKFNV